MSKTKCNFEQSEQKECSRKNLKFATKNKSGTAQIDNIGDMRATLRKLLRLLVQQSDPERRKSDEGKRTTLLGFLRSGFPKQMQMRHRYAESITVNAVANVDVWHLYRCNGMYDPRVALGGHQPMYFGRMGATYDHYVVTGATIRIDSVVVDSNATPPDSQAAIVGCILR